MNMATIQPFPLSPFAAELHELRRNWGWFLVLGIGLIIVGMLAIGAAFVATLATVLTFGILMLVGGGIEIVSAFLAQRWSGFFLHLLAGVLYLVVGFFMIAHPVAAAAGLTLMLAALFLAGGLFRIILSLSHRFPGWGWTLLNGVITLLLGFLIWRGWPEAAFWVIGLFVGIELIFAGWSWVMLALAVRNVPKATA
jgi:uncharacterized membrane protein HdeD (DUF308 family)